MIFWGREHPLSFEQECQFLKSFGFGVELLPTIKDHEECRYRRRNWSRLAEATCGMLVTMRSRNDKPTLEQWNEQIECAKLLGATIVTDLAGLHIRDGENVNGCEFASEVVKSAQEHDVTICLESGKLSTLKQLGEKLETLRYCLDTGYANLDSDFCFRQYVDELAERLDYLHLTDNYGQTDDHEPPGLRGGISRENWDYLLSALSRNGDEIIGSIEMCPCSPNVMIRQASEFLFDDLKWPGRPQQNNDSSVIGYNPS
jgi:sugar phosphate isomerase/epimerase